MFDFTSTLTFNHKQSLLVLPSTYDTEGSSFPSSSSTTLGQAHTLSPGQPPKWFLFPVSHRSVSCVQISPVAPIASTINPNILMCLAGPPNFFFWPHLPLQLSLSLRLRRPPSSSSSLPAGSSGPLPRSALPQALGLVTLAH